MVICGPTCVICTRHVDGLQPDAEGGGMQTIHMEGANDTKVGPQITTMTESPTLLLLLLLP